MTRRSKKKLNEYTKEYLRKRYAERRKEAVAYLGGKCVRCGSVDRLEIDHIDMKEKTMPFERMCVVSKDRYYAELDKCQLLCHPCHVKKTIEERGFNSRDQHGTLVCYQRGKCRCDKCRAANAAHSRILKKRRRDRMK